MLLALLFNTFQKLQVTFFRTALITCFTSHVLYVISVIYVLKFPFKDFISGILANLNFMSCHKFLFWRIIQRPVEHLWWTNFAKIVSKFWPLIVFAEKLHHGVRLGSKQVSAFYIFLGNGSSSFYKSLCFDNTLFLRFPQQSYFSFVLQIKNHLFLS